MWGFAKIADALPLLLLSAGVILMFNGLLQAIVLMSSPGARIAFDLGVLAVAPMPIEPARLWPWLIASGAALFLGGMVTRR